jgi:microcystin-dependent protein
MAEPFLSEIRIMSFGFPPKGWALCDGQLLPINKTRRCFRSWELPMEAMAG